MVSTIFHNWKYVIYLIEIKSFYLHLKTFKDGNARFSMEPLKRLSDDKSDSKKA